MKSYLEQVLQMYDAKHEHVQDADMLKYAQEWTRYAACEMHNISSLVGGVAAQELIKLCTQQRLPLFNTWLFSGITCASTTMEA